MCQDSLKLNVDESNRKKEEGKRKRKKKKKDECIIPKGSSMAEVSARRAHTITMEEHILAVTSTLNTSSCFVRLSTRCMSLTESSLDSPWNVSARHRVREPYKSGDVRRKRTN